MQHRFFAFVALLFYSCAEAQGVGVESLGSSSVRVSEDQVAFDLENMVKSATIRYENDKAWPRWDYADNRKTYDLLTKIVHHLAFGGGEERTLIIKGAASPLGREEYNQRLALRRAEVLRDIVIKMEGGDRLKIHVMSAGEDWKTFQSYIEENYHRENRDRVLAILHADATNDEKEAKLIALDQKRTWWLLVREFMASARSADVIRVVETAALAPKDTPLPPPLNFC